MGAARGQNEGVGRVKGDTSVIFRICSEDVARELCACIMADELKLPRKLPMGRCCRGIASLQQSRKGVIREQLESRSRTGSLGPNLLQGV